MQQNPHSAGSADSVDYYSTRNLHPRTGDCAAFTGRASGSDVSPRSDFHDDLLTPSKPVAEPSQAHEVPTNADVELEGVTADGGFAVNVGFDNINQSDLSPDEQGNLEGQVSATQPYRTAAQVEGKKPPHAVPPKAAVPKLAVVLMCAGTRGDVQPFIALGSSCSPVACPAQNMQGCCHLDRNSIYAVLFPSFVLLLQKHGHRVRVASHAAYRKFVMSFGLEFYPLGGDPKVLSDYIVKNRGIMPGSARDAYDQYREVESIVMSTYSACTETDVEGDGMPFTAQAIISNPPTYGHIHCAEKLGVPLHMFFTMPWSPTKAFPHPLARLNAVKDTRAAGYRNYLSYMAVDEFTYTGLVHVINKFRVKSLGLEPVRLGNKGPHLLAAHQLPAMTPSSSCVWLQVPFAYCWSEALVPKPADWGPHIDVVGYCFLNEGSHMKYRPPQKLKEFLAAGKPPVYIGFGSLIVDDAKKLTRIILEAAKEADQRVLLSRGWGNLGEGFDIPDTVMLLDNVPHDWLLPHCCAVVHHGGAGTTAAGLIAGCPTTVVPFFGDQPFWGAACTRMGVGPKPIPIDKLDTPSLVEALHFMMKPEVQAAATQTGQGIKHEDGLQKAVEAFHRHLPLEKLTTDKPVNWHLAKPHFVNIVSEVGRGLVGVVSEPVRGYREGGLRGTIKGMGKGLGGSVYYPLKGLVLSAEDIGLHAANAGLVVKTKTAEHYAGAKKGLGGCLGGTSTTGEHEGHELPSPRGASRADLAAEHELNPLADVRESEAEEDYEDAVSRSEEERQSQPPRRRFGVRFTHLSGHLPSITHHLPRLARSSRDKNLTRESQDGNVDKGFKAENEERDSSKQSSARQRSSGQHAAAPAVVQAGQLPTAPMHLYPQQSPGVLDANSSTEGQQATAPGHVPPGQLSDFPILS
ncbi:MAG: UDP-Glycosyltransferase superfamily isoform 1 [Trebouxia sp. A1-2]|nr:MAG: UDP-Glycosyltransferase superfamily isoform 1 [Trebouxia sp. A1-2]